jgi:hypothetical protein
MAADDFFEKHANEISRELKERRYIADFSPQSLWEIERFFQDRKDEPGDLLFLWPGNYEQKNQRQERIFNIGVYVGEVVRQHLEGCRWDSDDVADEQIRLHLPEGKSITPMKFIGEQITTYQPGNIVKWATDAGLKVGDPRKHPTAHFRSR